MKIGYALGGGAARGLAHIGVLKVLEERGIVPDVIAGTSIGAILGALYAGGKNADDIEKIAASLNWTKMLSLADVTLPSDGFIRGQRVMSMIKTVLGDLTFSQLKYPFRCVATDIVTGEEITLVQGSLVDAVRASFSIPGVFRPVYLDGRYLVDGGLVNVVPVNTCRAMGADYVIGVNVMPDPTSVMCKPRKGTQFEVCQLSESMSIAQGFEFDKSQSDVPVQTSTRKSKGRSRRPSIWEVLSQTMTITQYQVAKDNMKSADLAIAPHVENVEYWQFNRAAEIIAAGEEAARMAFSKGGSLPLLSR